MKKNGQVCGIGPISNGGESTIAHLVPYVVTADIEGVSDLLFHRWNNEAVAEKAAAAKGSKAKKSDDVESYLYRNEAGEICLPGEYVRQAIIAASKFRQDPRSPRKSACDLIKAAVFVTTGLASLGKKEFDFEDRRRVTVQRAGITRTRPAFKAGWKARLELMVNLPEYVSRELLYDLLASAGRLIGVGDFRPTYGRFMVTAFK
jgi:hypothetical protein